MLTFAIIFAVLYAGYSVIRFLMKGKTVATSTAQTAAVAAATAVKTDPVKGKMLSLYVTLKNYGATHIPSFLRDFVNNNKPALEEALVIEGEHLLQGGPSLVEADLAAMFSTMLAKRLEDSTEVQNLLNAVLAKLGPTHPALVAFAKTILPDPTKPVATTLPPTGVKT